MWFLATYIQLFGAQCTQKCSRIPISKTFFNMARKIIQCIDELKKCTASSLGIIHYYLSVFILFLYLVTSQIPPLCPH